MRSPTSRSTMSLAAHPAGRAVGPDRQTNVDTTSVPVRIDERLRSPAARAAAPNRWSPRACARGPPPGPGGRRRGSAPCVRAAPASRRRAGAATPRRRAAAIGAAATRRRRRGRARPHARSRGGRRRLPWRSGDAWPHPARRAGASATLPRMLGRLGTRHRAHRRRGRPGRGRDGVRVRRRSSNTPTPIPSDLDPGADIADRVRHRERCGHGRRGARQDQARRVPDQGEPHLRHDVRDVSRRRRGHEGQTCDGQTLPLGHATDRVDDAGHSFADGITAINGGRMDCFDPIGFVQYQQADIPNYWSYAQHFTLADRVLLLDLRADGRRAPVDVRVAVRPLRRSRATRAVRHRTPGVLRRPLRARVLAADGSTAPGRSTSSGWRNRAPAGAARDPDATTGRAGRAPTSRCCPTAWRPPASRGRSTWARTNGCSRCGWCVTCASARCTTTS